jgi:hypothetical protein
MPLAHEKLKANFTTTTTQLFYEIQLLLLLLMRLLQLETDRSKDRGASNSRTRWRPPASFAKSTDARFANRHPTAGKIHFG